MSARVERLAWRDIHLDPIDLPTAKLQLTLGLGSGLSRRPGDAPGRVYAVTDRGPNLFISQAIDDYGLTHLETLRGIRDAKIMPLPEIGPEIVELQVEGSSVSFVRRIPLHATSGARLHGAAPDGDDMEPLFDLSGQPLQPDPMGADTEAIAVMPDGSFFLAEEYGPSLLRADANGAVVGRWVVPGAERVMQQAGMEVRGVLPELAGQRRMNRGLEALCASPDGCWLYLGLQSGPSGADPGTTPIWKLDTASGELAGQWAYPFDAPASFRRDAARRKVGPGDPKVCEFAWAGEDRLLVLERIAHTTKLYLTDLSRLPEKRLLMSSDDHTDIGPDMEGMTILSPTEILLVSDNDFGVGRAETEFWRVSLDEPLLG